MKLGARVKRRAPKKGDTDHVAGISGEKIDKMKKSSHKEGKLKSMKTNIYISFEYHQEKARCPRITRKRKCHSTQDSQDRLTVFQHQIMLNERAIRARNESSRDNKVTLRKHQISLAGNMTVTLKANKSRETPPRRPYSPSGSSYDASPCFVFQVKSADFDRGIRIFADVSFDTTKLHS
jgi:hypothetical protein